MSLNNGYWARRSFRHLIFAVAAFAITYAALRQIPPADWHHRVSMSTAYAALAFLAASLLVGPWNVLRKKPNPVSFDLRRDLGIWAGILAVLHTAVGLTVHLRGRMWMYFFKRLHPLALQRSEFGFANYTGLIAAILFLMLLAISNDFALRRLGTRRWKSAQRWSYVAFGLTIAHGIGYQLVEKRHLPWVLIFAAMAATAIMIQGLGFMRTQQAAREPHDS